MEATSAGAIRTPSSCSHHPAHSPPPASSPFSSSTASSSLSSSLSSLSLSDSSASSTPSSSCLSLSQRYNLKVREAKAAYQSNRLQLALTSYQAAYDLISSDAKLKHRIESLQHRLTADGAAAPPALNTHHSSASPPLPAPPSPLRLERVDDLFDRDPRSGELHVRVPAQAEEEGEEGRAEDSLPHPSRYRLPAALYTRLYGYQREGVHWSHALAHFTRSATHCTTTPRAPAHSLNSTVHRPLLA